MRCSNRTGKNCTFSNVPGSHTSSKCSDGERLLFRLPRHVTAIWITAIAVTESTGLQAATRPWVKPSPHGIAGDNKVLCLFVMFCHAATSSPRRRKDIPISPVRRLCSCPDVILSACLRGCIDGSLDRPGRYA
ncbi:hypothetical protein F5Y19DRAFT_479180 [Xylariaceae sp. FL1651]|nr:hypothetical protein F5Y19DRAFT_479180 [Xylariaceae sp. FL1651]